MRLLDSRVIIAIAQSRATNMPYAAIACRIVIIRALMGLLFLVFLNKNETKIL